jgi:type II secretory pathway component PulM
VTDRPRATTPWLVIAASLALLVVLLYVLFVGYLPARQHTARLEAELRDLYTREAALQTRLGQAEERQAALATEVQALTAERDALAERLEALEREVARSRARSR